MNKDYVIDYYGSQKELARNLRISQAAISKWKTTIPEKQALKIERITGGKLKYAPEMYT